MAPAPLQAKVLTVSTRAAAGDRADLSGPALAEKLTTEGYYVVEARVITDGRDVVAAALENMCRDFAGLVVTTGGTGFSASDETPEGTAEVVERLAPGLAEAMRAASPRGRLSRGVAGTVGGALVLNLPGSPGGALECIGAVIDVLPHALELLAGGNAGH